MPVNKKMMSELKKQYGTQKGTNIYYALENKRKQEAKKPKAKAKKWLIEIHSNKRTCIRLADPVKLKEC